MRDLYVVRPASASALDRLAELLLELQDHLEQANPGLWRMKPEARKGLRAQIANRLNAVGSTAVVAEHRDEGVVGVAFGRVVANHRYDPAVAGNVDQVYVRPDHRRQGIATRLAAEVCRFFAQEGVTDLSLRYVIGNDEAAAFWQALGFAPRIITAGASLEEVQALLLSDEP